MFDWVLSQVRQVKAKSQKERATRALERQLNYQREREAEKVDQYDWYNDDLLRYSNRVGSRIKEHIVLPKKPKVLEVGSGAHGLIFFLGFQDCVGVDPLADSYRTMFPRWQQGVKTIQSRGESLPFGGDSFDLVLCDNVVDHAESPQQIIREIYRVLKPGGALYFTVNVHHPIYHAASIVYGAARLLSLPFEITPFADHTVHLSPLQANQLFEDMGFEPIMKIVEINRALDEAKQESPRHAGDLLKRVFFKNARFEIILRKRNTL